MNTPYLIRVPASTPPENYATIHFCLLSGKVPVLAMWNPQGWCLLNDVTKPCDKITHWYRESTEPMYTKEQFIELQADYNTLKIGHDYLNTVYNELLAEHVYTKEQVDYLCNIAANAVIAGKVRKNSNDIAQYIMDNMDTWFNEKYGSDDTRIKNLA